jgi:hypothetical protein
VAVPSGVPPDGRRHTFPSLDGGDQHTLTQAARLQLLETGIGADDPDNLNRIGVSPNSSWESATASTLRTPNLIDVTPCGPTVASSRLVPIACTTR